MRRRRRKSARSEDSENSRNLNVNDIRSFVRYRKVDEILGIYIRESLKASRWVAVKTSPIASRTRTKINIK